MTIIYRTEVNAMNAMKKLAETLKENYMEYVSMIYGPFDR